VERLGFDKLSPNGGEDQLIFLAFSKASSMVPTM
jgi:hypothetical protein